MFLILIFEGCGNRSKFTSTRLRSDGIGLRAPNKTIKRIYIKNGDDKP